MNMDVELLTSDMAVTVDMGEMQYVTVGGEGFEEYDGPYDVTPLAEQATTLETAQKWMTGNVTVEKIPYFETSNQVGGATVYIASEVGIYGDQ